MHISLKIDTVYDYVKEVNSFFKVIFLELPFLKHILLFEIEYFRIHKPNAIKGETLKTWPINDQQLAISGFRSNTDSKIC